VNGTVGTPLSYTRGTITTNQICFFGLSSNAVEQLWFAAKAGIFWFTAALPNATYLANARAYLQRRWGTV
jgi:hypothetical protein